MQKKRKNIYTTAELKEALALERLILKKLKDEKTRIEEKELDGGSLQLIQSNLLEKLNNFNVRKDGSAKEIEKLAEDYSILAKLCEQAENTFLNMPKPDSGLKEDISLARRAMDKKLHIILQNIQDSLRRLKEGKDHVDSSDAKEEKIVSEATVEKEIDRIEENLTTLRIRQKRLEESISEIEKKRVTLITGGSKEDKAEEQALSAQPLKKDLDKVKDQIEVLEYRSTVVSALKPALVAVAQDNPSRVSDVSLAPDPASPPPAAVVQDSPSREGDDVSENSEFASSSSSLPPPVASSDPVTIQQPLSRWEQLKNWYKQHWYAKAGLFLLVAASIVVAATGIGAAVAGISWAAALGYVFAGAGASAVVTAGGTSAAATSGLWVALTQLAIDFAAATVSFLACFGVHKFITSSPRQPNSNRSGASAARSGSEPPIPQNVENSPRRPRNQSLDMFYSDDSTDLKGNPQGRSETTRGRKETDPERKNSDAINSEIGAPQAVGGNLNNGAVPDGSPPLDPKSDSDAINRESGALQDGAGAVGSSTEPQRKGP